MLKIQLPKGMTNSEQHLTGLKNIIAIWKEEIITTEILIVGGGTSETIPAIQAGRAGAETILIESGNQMGGTTTIGGVTFTGIFHAWG